NPSITLDESPFFIPQEKTPWPQNGVPRYAGVSSFGLSGTNAHIVVGEAPQLPPGLEAETKSEAPYILPISARSAAGLEVLAKTYRDWLRGPEGQDTSLGDICYTASVRRSSHPYRAVVVGANKEELAERLGAYSADDDLSPIYSAPRIAFVFSGQG